MKKLIILFLFVNCQLSIINFASAQLSVGAKFGSNFSSITSYDMPDGFRGSLNRANVFGAMAEYALHKDISIQTEFLYSDKGEALQQINSNYVQKFNMSYLEMPLLVKYSFGRNALKPFVSAGPYVAYWIDGSTVSKDGQNLNQQNYSFADVFLPNNNTIIVNNRLDLGFSLGTGFTYAFGQGKILFDTRYEYGLKSYNKFVGVRPDNWKNHDNRVVSVTAGYLYTL